LTHAGNVYGQELFGGLSVSLDFLNLTTTGVDTEQVQVFTLHESIVQSGTVTQRTITSDYGGNFRSIDMGIGTNPTFAWSAGYRPGSWGVSVRRWNVDGDTSFSERITSPPERLTLSPVSSSLSGAVQGCRMWDHSLVPVEDTRDPSGLSPVDCHARNTFRASKMDVMLERVWMDGPPFQALVRIGAAVGRVEHEREEGQEQNAFAAAQIGSPPVLGASVDRFANRITLDSTSEASGWYWGPSIELAGAFTFKRLQVSWRVNQSLLIGDAELTAEWVDIDRISVVGRIGATPVTQSITSEGRYPISEKKRAVIPVLDSHVKAAYRVVGAISGGVGFFVSSWQGVPMASSWSVPGVWTDQAGTHWKENESNPAFYGLSIFGQVGF
jgi:hypothetical protein